TNADAWDALLLGLDESGQFDELATSLARLPAMLAADSRFARYQGTVARDRRDWPAAATAYLRAWQADPSDPQVLHRLCQAPRPRSLQWAVAGSASRRSIAGGRTVRSEDPGRAEGPSTIAGGLRRS